MSNSSSHVPASSYKALLRAGLTAWQELEAEYLLTGDYRREEVVEEKEEVATGYLRLVERLAESGEEIRIGGYGRRDGKNAKKKGQFKPWQH